MSVRKSRRARPLDFPWIVEIIGFVRVGRVSVARDRLERILIDLEVYAPCLTGWVQQPPTSAFQRAIRPRSVTESARIDAVAIITLLARIFASQNTMFNRRPAQALASDAAEEIRFVE